MDFLDDEEALQARYQTEGERWEAEESYNGYQLQKVQEEDANDSSVQQLFGEKQRLKDQGTALLRKWYVHLQEHLLCGSLTYLVGTKHKSVNIKLEMCYSGIQQVFLKI